MDMEWISVDDRLPEKEGTYLVCTSEMGDGKPSPMQYSKENDNATVA